MSNIGGRKMSKSKSEESGYDSDTTRKSGTSSQVWYWILCRDWSTLLTMAILCCDWSSQWQYWPLIGCSVRNPRHADLSRATDATASTLQRTQVSCDWSAAAILTSDWSRLCPLGGQVRDCSCRGLGEIQVGGFILFQCGKYIILQITFYISSIYIW